jgi:hypothetical protein
MKPFLWFNINRIFFLGRSLCNPQLLHMAKELQKLTTHHKEIERILMACKIDVTLSPWLKKLEANFDQFWLIVGPKLLTNARTLNVRILIKAGTLASRVANWLVKFDAILLLALRSIDGHKVQHLLVTWGILKRVFLFQLNFWSKANGADFNFCSNGDAWFELNEHWPWLLV